MKGIYICLRRIFDFRLLLKTEETVTKSTIKPFSTFLNKVSINPNTYEISYENVPKLLHVDYIFLRQVTGYRIHFPFIIEITRVEKFNLVQQVPYDNGIGKIMGDVGTGDVWYELEVFLTNIYICVSSECVNDNIGSSWCY